MKFFEVFKINVDNEINTILKDAEVESVTRVLSGGFLRIRINCSRIISPMQLRMVEDNITKQLLNGLVNVRIENICDYEFAEPGTGTYNDQMKSTAETAAPSKAVVSSDSPAGNSTNFSSYSPGAGGTQGNKTKYKAKKKGPDEGMLYGRQFEGQSTPINEIIGDMKQVIVCGMIFENDLTTTKNGF